MKPQIRTLAWVVCCSLAVICVAAAGEEGKIDDKTFVAKAAQGNLTEIALGKLAAQNAEDAAVKKFGQRMLDDHGKANKELESIAANKFTLPKELDEKNQATVTKLGELKGADFDRAYMKHMVMSHKMGSKLYESQQSSGQDPELKAFAAKVLPVVREHLKMAERISAKVGE
jgi:putative membrane protein